MTPHPIDKAIQLWSRSLEIKLKVLLVVSAVGPVLAVLAVLAVTGWPGLGLLLLGLIPLEAVVLIAGGHMVTWITAPLQALNTRLRLAATGDLRQRLPSETVLHQRAGIDRLLAGGADALLLSAVDAEALVPDARAAQASGIPVVAVDSGLAHSAATDALVETDQYAGGRLAGETMIALLGGQGQVGVLGLSRHQTNGPAREAGFRDALAAAPGITLVSVQYGLGAPALAEHLASEMLAAYPRLAGICAVNEGGTLGVLAALRGPRGAGRQVRVIGWDAAPPALQALRAGTIDALIVQRARLLGWHAVATALAALEGRAIPPVLRLPAVLLTAATLDEPEAQALLSGADLAARPPPPPSRRAYRLAFANKGKGALFWEEVKEGANACARAAGATIAYHASGEADLDELGLLRENFNQMIDSIQALVQQLQQEAAIIGPRAGALVKAAADQAAVAAAQTAALEQLSSGVRRLGGIAQQIGAATWAVGESAAGTLHGVEAAELAVTDSSQRLQAIVARLGESLDVLSRRTTQVAAVADNMRAIADEIHLLALNASIEAADAGVAGRRFGVIADEVRQLAGGALAATADFQGIAGDMRAAADNALAATQDSARGTDLSRDLVAQATGAMERIAGLARHTNEAVQAIRQAVGDQQATGSELDGFAAQVTATARSAAEASAALSAVAQDLTAVVARLQESVGAFRLKGDPAGPPATPGAERAEQLSKSAPSAY